MSLRHHANHLLKNLERPFVPYNRIEVSRSALRHNLQLMRQLSGLPVIPVLKGNAYGHGLALVAEALKHESVPYLAVDGYFEALRVREVTKQPVLIMGMIRPENFAALKYQNFTFVVQDAATIEALGRTGRAIKIHLEVNTGMNRYGSRPQELAQLTRLTVAYPNLHLEGVMGHLADSDGTTAATIEAAVAAFEGGVAAVRGAGGSPSLLHLAQTAGSVVARTPMATATRMGIGLYGLNPFPPNHPHHGDLARLQPALQLVSAISKVIDLHKGDQVGYNYTFTAPQAMRIGILPLGYYEGVNRALSNTGVVIIGDAALPIVGRVCMNHTIVDLSGTNAGVGDEVVVYSNQPTAANSLDQIATRHGLFNYNLATALSPDVRRILVD